MVTYEWTAVIDPGWNLAVERADGSDREWIWRSVEGPGPAKVIFTGDTAIVVLDTSGGTYEIDFDAATLEPSDRYCLRTEYCNAAPWDQYTRTGP